LPDVKVKDQIKKLIDIQRLDGEIYSLRQELKDKPGVLADLKAAFEEKQANLRSLEEKTKDVQVQRNSLEKDLQVKEDGIAKANAQLTEIKTNKEYTAKLNEIEHLKADTSILEEKILISYDEVEKIKGEMEAEKARLSDEEKQYLSQKQEIEGSVAEAEDRIKVLDGQRNQLVPDIDPRTLKLYERILNAKQGMAIVPVMGNACGGCHMNLPQQVINQIKMGEEIISCELCNRLLYIEEDL